MTENNQPLFDDPYETDHWSYWPITILFAVVLAPFWAVAWVWSKWKSR